MPLNQSFPFSEDSVLELSVKLCLKSMPNTALLMGFRKEDVSLGEGLGRWRPLRYAVEKLKDESAAASFSVVLRDNTATASTSAAATAGKDEGASDAKEFVVYVVPASRFSHLLKRALPTLDKQVMKENATHFVIVVLSKQFDDLRLHKSKT